MSYITFVRRTEILILNKHLNFLKKLFIILLNLMGVLSYHLLIIFIDIFLGICFIICDHLICLSVLLLGRNWIYCIWNDDYSRLATQNVFFKLILNALNMFLWCHKNEFCAIRFILFALPVVLTKREQCIFLFRSAGSKFHSLSDPLGIYYTHL